MEAFVLILTVTARMFRDLGTQINITAALHSLFAPKSNLLEIILPSSRPQVSLENATKMFS